jgi:hypothetical protein
LAVQVKALMQKTQPDKVEGFEEQFKQLQQCKEWKITPKRNFVL